ncbi:MAG: ParB family transcriptional regulator, chromosome partitioning protein [Pseudonocardiales bacterium]|jgi:ParB family chromosome partitioning protein|nr:ParB family transcriptional regulator, chromosome partitioning protein [Pseudonocardiales bacterium]
MSSRSRRGGLGRGLGALIPTAPAPEPASADPADPTPYESPSGLAAASIVAASVAVPAITSAGPPGTVQPAPVPGATFAELPLAAIHANARQPRQVFDEDALAELAHSIHEFGVLQPVVVRADGDGYELVMGERRLRAAASAGLETIPAIVRTTADEAMLRDALLENIHRAQLNPLEEAAAYQQLLEEFGITHDELAHRIGRSRPHLSNTLRLLNLPLAVQRRVAAGVLSAGHARALLGLEDGDQQDELASRIVAEGLSVRATEELVSLAQRDGSPTKPTRQSPARRITAPGVAELAGKLSDVLDTRVRVDIGRRKGKITVEFATIDDLERIVALMAPQLEARHSGDDAQPSERNEP